MLDAGRIAVVRVLPGLGDLLCLVPALRALRSAAPQADIALIGMAGAAWMAERYPAYLDRVIPCPAWPGLPEVDGPAAAADAFARSMRAERFDLALQAHGDGSRTNALTAALGADRWVGLAVDPATACGCDAGARRALVGPYRRDRHEVERCLDVVRLLGVDGDARLEFPTTPAEERAAAAAADGRIAVVHPGASVPERRWPPERFAAIVDHLLDRVDHVDRVVLTGAAAEHELTAAVAAGVQTAARRSRLVDVAGRTPLGVLGALLRRAELVVANDTGTAHLAAAVGTPAVTVSSGADVERWAPVGASHCAVDGGEVGRWPGTDEVVAAVDVVLADRLGVA